MVKVRVEGYQIVLKLHSFFENMRVMRWVGKISNGIYRKINPTTG